MFFVLKQRNKTSFEKISALLFFCFYTVLINTLGLLLLLQSLFKQKWLHFLFFWKSHRFKTANVNVLSAHYKHRSQLLHWILTVTATKKTQKHFKTTKKHCKKHVFYISKVTFCRSYASRQCRFLPIKLTTVQLILWVVYVCVCL